MAKKNLIESEDVELLRIGCQSTVTAILEQTSPNKAEFSYQIEAEHETHNFIWDVVNQRNFMENYLKEYTLPYLKTKLKSAMADDINRVSTKVPIGKTFFARTMILRPNEIPYTPEPHSLVQLLNPAPNQLWRWSRRLAKSWTMKLDMVHSSVFEQNCYSLLMCQSWDVSKEHLGVVDDWFSRNPLLFTFSGGELPYRLRQKWSDSDKSLNNGSRMSCRSATFSRKISGKGPNRLYEDEKALYPHGSHSEELSILSRGQDVEQRDQMVHIIASAPAGDGTLFEKMCKDPNIRKYWNYSELKVCDNMTFDDNDVPSFHGIVTNRLTNQDLLEEWYILGPTRFMEQFMLVTASVDNRAISDDIIDTFFERKWGRQMSSEFPCILSYDLGKSTSHRSVILIGELHPQPGGQMHIKIIRIHKFEPGTPFRSRVVTKAKIKGVIDMIPDFCEAYNVEHIIGDAHGLGLDEPFKDMQLLLRENGLTGIKTTPYQWGRDSKEFMGKDKLWFNLVKPNMELGNIRCYYDEDFAWEMRQWQATPSPTGKNTQLRAMKQTQSDDIITTMMQLCFAGLKGKASKPPATRAGKGLYESAHSGKKGFTPRRVGGDFQPRWRRDKPGGRL